MGTWAVPINSLVPLTSIWWRNNTRKNIKQRIWVCISGHKAIRTAFPNSIKSQEAAIQDDGDMAMSRGKAMSSTRKAEGHKQRVPGYTTSSCWSWHFQHQAGLNVSMAWEQYHSVANPLKNQGHGQSLASHWFLSGSAVLKATALFFFSSTKGWIEGLTNYKCNDLPWVFPPQLLP